MAEKEFIERNRLIGKLEKGEKLFKKSGYHRTAYVFLALKREIERMPADDAATVVHGKNETEMNPVDEFICSECGFASRDMSGYDIEEDCYYEFNPHFCPNCGAKMDGDDENA